MLYDVPRHKLPAAELLNYALKLSVADLIFEDNPKEIPISGEGS